jgi:hypothetical protein
MVAWSQENTAVQFSYASWKNLICSLSFYFFYLLPLSRWRAQIKIYRRVVCGWVDADLSICVKQIALFRYVIFASYSYRGLGAAHHIARARYAVFFFLSPYIIALEGCRSHSIASTHTHTQWSSPRHIFRRGVATAKDMLMFADAHS